MKRFPILFGLLVGLFSVCVATPASASPRERARPRARPAAESAKPKVTILVDVPPKDRKRLKGVLRWIRKGLRRNEKLDYIPMQRLLEKPKGSMQRIRKAVRLMDQATRLMQNLEFAKAIPKLNKAVRKLEYSFLGLLRLKVKAQPLADALRLLATAYFLDGQAKMAKATVQRLLVISPKIRYKAGLFPKQMAQLVDDERLMFDEFGTSTVVIKTEPPGARVYLNAKRVGRSPITVKGVRRGFNYLTARLPGYRTTTMGLPVDPPKLKRVTVKLRRFKRDPLPLMARAFMAMGKPEMGKDLDALAERMDVDILVLARAEAFQDLAKVTLFAYDRRLGELLKGPVKVSISQDFPKPKALRAAQMLLSGVRLDGKRPPPPKKPRRSTWVRFKDGMIRFRRWKGFWPTVGTIAGIVVTGVVVGLAVGLGPPDGAPVRGSRHVILGHPLTRF